MAKKRILTEQQEQTLNGIALMQGEVLRCENVVRETKRALIQAQKGRNAIRRYRDRHIRNAVKQDIPMNHIGDKIGLTKVAIFKIKEGK